MALGELDWYMQKNETRPPTSTIYQNKLKMNISCDTIKVLVENLGRKISNIPHNNVFADISPIVREIKEKVSKWD